MIDWNHEFKYKYYLSLITDLRLKIYLRIQDEKENIFDIKASTKWLKTFETETFCVNQLNYVLVLEFCLFLVIFSKMS